MALIIHSVKGSKLEDLVKSNGDLRCDDFRCLIADFGLSKVVDPDQSQSVLGNRKYDSPEVTKLRAEGIERGNYSPLPSDVFSLGMLFYDIAEGETPFKSGHLLDESGFNDIFTANVEPALSKRWRRVSRDFMHYLQNMLSWDPTKRPAMPSIADLIEKVSLRGKNALDARVVLQDTYERETPAGDPLVLLVGPSGAGKTSTILHLIGMVARLFFSCLSLS